MDGEVRITVIATGFARAEGARPRGASPRQVAMPVSSVVAARREAPPPLPAATRQVAEPRACRCRPARCRPARSRRPPPEEPPAAPHPRTAPVRAAPVRAGREVTPYQAGEEDQYDIPAFLRRGRQAKES